MQDGSYAHACVCVPPPLYRKAWKALGNMTQEEARHGLISLLDAATPKLREFVLEQWKAQKTPEE